MERLSGVYAKLDRAREHREALEAEVAAFLGREPYSVTDDFNRDEQVWTFRFEVREEIPLLLSTIAGDATHNLRSALDHLVWQLVEASGGTPSRANQFPICLGRDQWRDRRLGAPYRLRELRSLTAAAEIQRVQPYVRWDEPAHHPLAVLDVLANTDKHRLLLPAIGTFDLSNVYCSWNDDAGGIDEVVALTEPGGWFEHGTELVKVRLSGPIGPNPKVKMDPLPPPDIVLDQSSPLSAGDTFRIIEQFVRVDVVAALERFLV